MKQHAPMSSSAMQETMSSGDGSRGLSNDLVQQNLGALPPAVMARLRASFGAAVDGVRFHQERGPIDAVNAGAGAAMGRAVYVDPTLDLGSDAGFEVLSEEVAHALQPSSGGQGVSAPNDPAEQEAQAMAAQATRGEAVGQPSTRREAAVHRDGPADPLAELRQIADAMFDVDEARALEIIQTELSPAQLQQVAGDGDLIRALCGAFNAQETWTFIRAVPFTLSWQIYCIDYANVEGDITAGQYAILLSDASEADRTALVSYGSGASVIIEHAPSAMTPLMRLQALQAEGVEASSDDVLQAVRELGLDHAITIREDQAIMGAIAGMMDGEEMFEVMRLLKPDVKWQVYWIDRAGGAGDLDDDQWAAMLFESSPEAFAELRGWTAMWDIVRDNAGADILLQAQGFLADPTVALDLLRDADAAEEMLDTLGAQAVMAMIAGSGDVPTLVGVLEGGDLIEDLLDGL
ncbi:MAG: DUF4157 domain-containing protein, partial [Myxococcota bacterium]